MTCIVRSVDVFAGAKRGGPHRASQQDAAPGRALQRARIRQALASNIRSTADYVNIGSFVGLHMLCSVLGGEALQCARIRQALASGLGL